MDLNELLVFVRVVDEGSFTAASRSLQMPKSTVSHRVSRLEEHLGARLLQRTTRSLGLTDAGAALYERGARIAAELEEAERAVTELEAEPRGTLRITAPVDLGYAYLGGIVAAYRARFPAVHVNAVITDRLVDMVEEGFDLAIRAGALEGSTLIARKLATVESHLFAGAGYLERRGAPATPADLAEHDCLVFTNPPDPARWKLQSSTGERETVVVTSRVAANSLQTVRDAVLGDAGIALLPVSIGAAPGAIRRVLPEWRGRDVTMQLVYPSSRYLSPKVRSFIDFVADAMRPPPWEAGQRG